MPTLEREEIGRIVRRTVAELGYEEPGPLRLERIPFSGEWGWASPVCFKLASQEEKIEGVSTAQRAQAIAKEVCSKLAKSHYGFHRVEALRGYINIYLSTPRIAKKVLCRVQQAGAHYGQGLQKDESVMVEYSQPNTHKAFHVGHLRNVCLGNALSNIIKFAGFRTITANYPGDIGMHVIKCLWGYLRFHRGQEPKEDKGKWLGNIYAESDRRLEKARQYRSCVIEFVRKILQEESAGTAVRLNLCSRFFEEVESGLAQNSNDDEWRKDALSFLEMLFTGRPLEVNEMVARPFGEWIWQTWLSLGSWLLELQEGCTEQVDSLKALRQEYERIGNHEDIWAYAKEIRQLYSCWESQDAELLKLWDETRKWSLEGFMRIYRQLDVDFDVWFYESEVEEEGKAIVDELIAKGIAQDGRPNGPVIVEIDKILGLQRKTYGTIVILRSDGTSLYSTKDLALAKRKFEEYGIQRSVYVVDVGQSLYFKQIFKVLELWGFRQAEKCFHLAYEVVRLPSGRMSSREGDIVLYDDFFSMALAKAREYVNAKKDEDRPSVLPRLDHRQRERVARAVALGAMKYGMLSVDNSKIILFDIDAALSFDGQTAPYIQYAYARACRILDKAADFEFSKQKFEGLHHPFEESEVNLLESIARFPDEVERAARDYRPLGLAVYLFSLAKCFTDFYRDCPVLKATMPSRQWRLALVAATKQTLANGLGLLGIKSPRYM